MVSATTTGAPASGSRNGGPAEYPFGDVQTGVAWTTIRYEPAVNPPMSATITSPPS
jgi:hypothetical protein